MDKKDSRRKKANRKQKTKQTPDITGKRTEQQNVATTVEEGINDDKQEPTRKPSIYFDRCVLLVAVAALVVNFFVFLHIKKDSRLQHRAWMGLEKGLHQPIAAGAKIECRLRFTNTGKTPAIIVSAVYTVKAVSKNEIFDVVSYVNSHTGRVNYGIPSRGAIPPNATILIKALSEKEITEDAAAQVKNGKLVVYVFGDITYDDIFGERHQTRYCLIVEPATPDLRAYKEYNSMD